MASSVPRTIAPNAIRILRDPEKVLQKIKKVDPRERYVLLYPGSDAAYVGMGFKLLNIPAAEKVYEEASDIVKKNMLKLCLEGPKSDLLDSIESRHLATFVTSHATIAKLNDRYPTTIQLSKAVGGFGIGYINSLVFSGALSFQDGLDLIRKQGQAMERASKIVPTAKIKVRVMPATSKSRVCRSAVEHCLNKGIPPEVAICSVTKQLHAHVMEIAGHEEAINYLEEEGPRLFRFRWLSRVKKDPLAFHTDLMKPAQEYLRVYLNQKIKENPNYLREPETSSVYSATTGCRTRSVKQVMKALVDYPVKPILVEQLLHCLYTRPDTLAMPNTLVLWDRRILDTLALVNRRARQSAKLID